jgi:hypothetical protein
MRETTEIRLNEYGDETHESWLLIRANNVSQTPGKRLFDSEVPHQHFIVMTVTRCTRKRDLNRDWMHGTEVLMEVAMSQAQWGAFVSSFGQGSGVPATLECLHGTGTIPEAPPESRFDQSHAEVRESGAKALADLTQSYANVMAAFENGGKRALRDALTSMGHQLRNAPLNMEFAAKSLTEHVESVVTKARADIEGMVLSAMEQGTLAETVVPFQLDQGNGGGES